MAKLTIIHRAITLSTFRCNRKTWYYIGVAKSSPPPQHAFRHQHAFFQYNNIHIPRVLSAHTSTSGIAPANISDQHGYMPEFGNLDFCVRKTFICMSRQQEPPKLKTGGLSIIYTYVSLDHIIGVIPYVSCQAKVTDFCYSTMS